MNNTVEPVFKSETKVTLPIILSNQYYINCQGGDGLLNRCTLTFNQGDKKYKIPIVCEQDKFNEYTCEVF